MAVLLSAAGLFAGALVIHVIWWRLSVPRAQFAALLGLFLATGAAGFVVLSAGDPFHAAMPLPRFLLAILLFGSFSLVYLVLFSALEADSPTLTVLGLIAEAGSAGIHKDALMRGMEQHPYVELRINQMIADGMAVETNAGLRLGTQGLWLSSLVLIYRRLLGRKHLGG